MKVGVLVSGSGTNLQALIDAQAGGELGPARIVVVGANVPGCAALARAAAVGIETFVVDHRIRPGTTLAVGGDVEMSASERRQAFDRALLSALRARGVELVVLAGFMRLLTPVFLEGFPSRVINIHPSLLPAFPGLRAQAQAFEHGVKLAGCTVHFVETGIDSGPIIAQAAVAIREDDDADGLRRRILLEEHRLLPEVVRAIAEARVTIAGRRVRVTPIE